METYQYPRFTRALRAFSNLSGPRKPKGPQHNNYEDYKKWKKNHIKNGLTWKDIKEELCIGNDKNSEISKLLSQIKALAIEISGEYQSQDVTDDAALYLLLLFLDEPMVLQLHQAELKSRFGSVTFKQASKAHEITQQLAELAGPETVERLKAPPRKSRPPPFAKIIPFKSQNLPASELQLPPEANQLSDLTKALGVNVINEFSMKLESLPPSVNTSCENKKNNKKISRSWLQKKLKQSFQNNASSSSLNLTELEESIITSLNTNRSTDELQNELFDLLGFDRFELIQDILAYRQEICQAATMSNLIDSGISGTSTERKQTNYCVQVTVQSEKEKQLIKQVRKDEKRIQKAASRLPDSDEEENKFDPVALREKRLLALRAAQMAPILTKMPSSSCRSSAPEQYPFVFDSQQQAQTQAGFIAGTRLLLPEDIKRVDNRTYEEVEIPISRIPPPKGVGDQRVRIETLDSIGQIAFQGILELNRIQSIVFDAAYNTNENLLICAPTGAGKTNVAMLTIVHQIRQFVENDIILKDKFKIVYVAPMKALATEMTKNFGDRLGRLGLTVKELTGDMQLTKSEILNTQMLVTTPEKWDVVTRKSSGDVALTQIVKLLILDEVHLLHGDRGPVVEALVARTLRLVESSQSMIRIVGLSATLPNYIDISRFLRVNPYKGLFFFDSRFRPVPLSTCFVGVKALKPMQQMSDMDQVCYDKVVQMVRQGHQVMVFVHARNATVRTANVLRELASQKNELGFFMAKDEAQAGLAAKAMQRAKSKPLADLFQSGFSVHHAGLLRSDRSLVEKYFSEGLIKVLVCTSTLAWGVNLPAHAVIIRGTEIYDSKHGSFIDLGILDVLQIFGRAGRPQFDTSGHGVIITSHDKLSHYLSLLTNQFPIESNFINCLVDNLNAEVTLGTISNVDEAVQWLSYTYLYVRIRMNPQFYGFNYQDVMEDPNLSLKRRDLIISAARQLDKAKMMRFCERTGDLKVTDLGRTASHFYLKHATVEVINELMNPFLTEAEILNMVSQSEEFTQLKVRDDELEELDKLCLNYCNLPIAGGSENIHGKVNILMQTFLSKGYVSSFSLQSDLAYINQNSVRIVRALFEISLRQNNPLLAGRCLLVSKMLEQQQWEFESPLRQYRVLTQDVIEKLESRNLSIHRIRDMDSKEVGQILRHLKMGQTVKKLAYEFPLIELESSVQPITRTVLRIRLTINANFTWNDKIHGRSHEGYYIWVEDPDNNFIYHSEYFMVTRKQVITREPQELVMTIPLVEPLPAQYIVRAISDRWLQCEATTPLMFKHLILPDMHPPHTSLLPLQPLPITALNNLSFQSLYKFTHFNPIQTQLFHRLFHTDGNVLLGAPTGSGKTIVAELAMLRVFVKYPKSKVVYIAPLKALVRERMQDWTVRLHSIGKKVVELTGDVTPDARAIANADVIVTTPEKWDGISRSWQTRSYVRSVALIVIDEIHLLGEDRGPVLEVIVSRTNYISSHTEQPLRIIGLSTALANARDLAEWLGIQGSGMYNFRPSVRPVPLEVHISGFPGKHYCPRMFTMNRPTFQAIRQYSPCQPVLVFVSSRRQTRLTALDLIAFLAAEDNPKQWLHLPENALEQLIAGISDNNLKLTLAFGIGLHHAGLNDRDRRTVEELFLNQKIQVLIATATLAWGVNLPAHLVVIKGTEYYDGKLRRYVDMPITDVLQMMGRAGRPQFDEQGIAVVLVHDQKKTFYKKFLYEPFPVESSLLGVLPDHLNAEIVAGTITNKQQALDYLTWTYLFRRLLQNPTYYELTSLESAEVNNYLSHLVNNAMSELYESACIGIEDDERTIYSTSSGRIASYYYLNHKTVRFFMDSLNQETTIDQCFEILSKAQEFSQLPVRHNEDLMNADLAKSCPLNVDPLTMDSAHTKCLLLLQAHMSRLELPCSDYLTDTKSVLDQAIRVIQAMIDISAEKGFLATTLRLQMTMQACIQGRWPNRFSSLLTLPHLREYHIELLEPTLRNLPSLQLHCKNDPGFLNRLFISELSGNEIHSCLKVLKEMPILSVNLQILVLNEEPIDVEQDKWLKVPVNSELFLDAKIFREERHPDLKVHCPRFPRGATEGWFLTLGDIEKRELLALKRITGIRGRNPTHHQLTFYSPEKPSRVILTLYITSDCYLGIDQQYEIRMEAF